MGIVFGLRAAAGHPPPNPPLSLRSRAHAFNSEGKKNVNELPILEKTPPGMLCLLHLPSISNTKRETDLQIALQSYGTAARFPQLDPSGHKKEEMHPPKGKPNHCESYYLSTRASTSLADSVLCGNSAFRWRRMRWYCRRRERRRSARRSPRGWCGGSQWLPESLLSRRFSL